MRNVVRLISPIKETGDVMQYIKICRGINSETTKTQMLAQTFQRSAILQKKFKIFLMRTAWAYPKEFQ